jgi:pantetheine-phosphate adenylyltransferase
MSTNSDRPSADSSASDRQPRMAVYAGVFDPPTVAHLEMFEKALQVFDRLTVVVSINIYKAPALFSPEERVRLIEESLSDGMRRRITVVAYAGLIAPYAESIGACALVRGMRPYTDPDAEIALALVNQKLAPGLPTMLLVTSAKNVYLSSSFVRETAQVGGMIVPGTVSPAVEEALRRRFGHLAVDNGPAESPTSQAAGREA